VITVENEKQRLVTILFSIEFSDYGATIVSKLSLLSIYSCINFLPLRLDRVTSTKKDRTTSFFKKFTPFQHLKDRSSSIVKKTTPLQPFC